MRRVDRVVVVLKMRRARRQDFTTAMDQPPPLPIGATTRQQLTGIEYHDFRPVRICDLTVYAVRTPIISDSLRATRSSRIKLLVIFDILNESKQIHLPGVVALQYCQQRLNLRTKPCEGPVQTSASEPGFATALGPRFTRFATSKSRPLALHISYKCSR